MSYRFDSISCCSDGCQHWSFSPLYVSFNAPVESKNGHENDGNNPEDTSKGCLISKEEINQSHDG